VNNKKSDFPLAWASIRIRALKKGVGEDRIKENVGGRATSKEKIAEK